MALPLETVVKQLTDSGIIAPGKLDDFVPPNASPIDGEALLRELHKQKLLTKFQAQQVAANRAKALILGNYLLIDKIGVGGMGQVFKAEHRRMKRVVAIKMLPKAMLQDAAAAARFQREVEAAAKLNHQNIVAAHDADEANGVHFLVMEYVEGQDLSALVKQDGPFPVAKAVNYILQAARGLELAHRKGIVHRDIKPANLLLDKEGVVKILDMGLARIASDGAAATQAELTGTGAVMGTVEYMAPEQALSTRNADARADIYSLGCTLYYLLAGKPPYDGETLMAKMLAHREQPIPSLGAVQANIPQPLEAVFRAMVAKDVDDRYQSMSEVISALESLGLTGAKASGRMKVVTPMTLSAADRDRRTAKMQKTSLTSVTSVIEVVASEKSKHVFAKIVGGAFATIIAPVLVTFLIKYLDRDAPPAKPPMPVQEAQPSPSPAAPKAEEPPALAAGQSDPKAPARVVAAPGKDVAQTKDAASGKGARAKDGGATRTIDLLAQINVQRDVISGEWHANRDELLAAGMRSDNVSRLQLPYLPAEEYDYEIEFTPLHGSFRVGQIFSAGGHSIEWEMDSKRARQSNWASGFSRLDGLSAVESPESLKHDEALLTNGQRYRSRVEVRSGSLRALLDDKELLTWRGDFSRFSGPEPKDQLTDPLCLGLVVYSRRVTFHKIMVREVTGRGKLGGR